MSKQTETHAFQTEVQQLLHLIIHSLYSNKEIFLRELISNASDACDRLRFMALTDESLRADAGDGAAADELGIWVEADAKRKTLCIRDNGIGMDRDEVIANIGTIARSGTRKFVETMSEKESADASFIGQFGVGFYSAFLVAKEVTLLTRRAGRPAAEGVKWTSDGGGEFRLETVMREARGTEVILKLQADQREYLDDFRLRSVIGKYSNHIALPIYLPTPPAAADDATAEDAKAADGDANKATDAEVVDAVEVEDAWQRINQGAALWARPKNEITAEQHNAFYTALTYDPEPPAITLHNRVEGKMEYISLFYVPAKAPFDLWDRERRHGIKLYVRRIFIAEDAKQLMPNYLRFVRGLVDAADLPLNVSREFLQQNKMIDKIRAASVKKVLAELAKIARKDEAQYAELWKQYGRVLKEGVVEDFDNRDAVVKLLRFASTRSRVDHDGARSRVDDDGARSRVDDDGVKGDGDAQTVSLEAYVNRMPMKQKAIYYVTAESHAAAAASPHLEVFNKHNVEVLLLSDPVDEWVVGHLPAYNDKPLQSIAKGDLDLADVESGGGGGEADAAADDAKGEAADVQPLVEKLKAVLGEKVKDVRLSSRLVDSPACLVADANDLGGNLQRILQAIGQEAPTAKPILEINPRHAIVRGIDADGEFAEDWANVLFDHAALAEGAGLGDPGGYVKRVNRLLAGSR